MDALHFSQFYSSRAFEVFFFFFNSKFYLLVVVLCFSFLKTKRNERKKIIIFDSKTCSAFYFGFLFATSKQYHDDHTTDSNNFPDTKVYSPFYSNWTRTATCAPLCVQLSNVWFCVYNDVRILHCVLVLLIYFALYFDSAWRAASATRWMNRRTHRGARCSRLAYLNFEWVGNGPFRPCNVHIVHGEWFIENWARRVQFVHESMSFVCIQLY